MESPMNYNKRKEVINQVSRADGFSQDSYFGLANSFQYSENINCDDELHGIKLSTKIDKTSSCAGCQLIEVGNTVFAFPIENGGHIRYFNKTNWSSGGTDTGVNIPPASTVSGWDVKPGFGTLFQNNFWFGVYLGNQSQQVTGFITLSVASGGQTGVYVPYDHDDYTDESISTPDTTKPMGNAVTCVLNFNNSRLIVASGNELRCYYPELDRSNPLSPIYQSGVGAGQTGWKKVQTYRGGNLIVGLTCTFEYLKVWVQDRGYNTKIFYYQANDDFRSTFVYNQIDLRNVRVMRVYSINGIDYYTESLDGTDGFVSFNKLIGSTPVQIFTRKGGLVSEDIFSKAGYFIGPTSLDASYLNGYFYVADAHGVFKFRYDPSGRDVGYLKWKCTSTKKNITGLAICQNYVYVSYSDGLYRMRLYDTGQDGYESSGILISRELEGNSYQGCFTKMLDQVRLNYELNPELPNSNGDNGSIEVFVSPNNTRTDTNPSGNGSDGWYKVMEISKDMKNTRTQTSNLLNNFNNNDGETGFEYDRQTITYLIRINKGTNNKATPIVREIQLWYHTKGKANELYDLQNPTNG